MTAHTKGPWIYINNWPDMRIESADGKYVIADYDTSFIEYPDDDENEANARLIAAAPDLLSVAYAALEVGERIDHDPDSALGELVAAALAAIAKAKGEQP